VAPPVVNNGRVTWRYFVLMRWRQQTLLITLSVASCGRVKITVQQIRVNIFYFDRQAGKTVNFRMPSLCVHEPSCTQNSRIPACHTMTSLARRILSTLAGRIRKKEWREITTFIKVIFLARQNELVQSNRI
jgi:hypothetical protein